LLDCGNWLLRGRHARVFTPFPPRWAYRASSFIAGKVFGFLLTCANGIAGKAGQLRQLYHFDQTLA
jgi:hypothetical protein